MKKPPPTLPRTGEDGVEITGGKGNEVVRTLKCLKSERLFILISSTFLIHPSSFHTIVVPLPTQL